MQRPIFEGVRMPPELLRRPEEAEPLRSPERLERDSQSVANRPDVAMRSPVDTGAGSSRDVRTRQPVEQSGVDTPIFPQSRRLPCQRFYGFPEITLGKHISTTVLQFPGSRLEKAFRCP